MKKYRLSADAVPEFEAIVATEEQAIAIHAMLTALTNYRRNLHGNDAYITYHNREEEDLEDSFDRWAEGCDMIWTEIIEVE